MLAKTFEKPLRVFVGLGFPRQLNTAVRACEAALAGEVDAETVRGVFAAFARKKDILLDDDDNLLPPRILGAQSSHV